jgi:xylulokinase
VATRFPPRPHNEKVSARQPLILAVDLGTTEAKAGLIDADGRLLATARAGYTIDVDAGEGRAEQDPEAWWAALAAVSRELMAADDERMAGERVAGVCIVGQGPTMIPVDAKGRATHPAITWMDGRPAADAPELERATGLRGWGLGILPAARWLERHDPEAAAATRWYLNAWEWAAFRLSGIAAATRSFGQVLPEPADAASAGLAVERLPPVVEAGSVLGGLTTAAAEALGLPAGIAVVAGTVDSFASFHGAGLIDPGDAVDTGGTSGGLAVYWDQAVQVPGIWAAPAPLPGRWFIGGAMTATGKALDWLDERVLAGGPGPDGLIAEAAGVPPAADGLIFLPYLAGERSPIWDPAARGAFIGLTLAHGRAHLARAVLEAAALALRHLAAPIAEAGVRIDQLTVTGGTARSDTWNQIKADVLQVPVAVPAVREAAVLGAAILASLGLGWHADTLAAIRAMATVDHRLEPDQALRATYDDLFSVYTQLWPAIALTVHRLAGTASTRLPPRAEV